MVAAAPARTDYRRNVSWQPIHLPLSAAETALLHDASARLSRYVDDAQQIMARARANPAPDSEAAQLHAQQQAPPEIEHAELRLSSALEHLDTLANALVPGNAPLLFAPFTLMRTALEGAGYAAWAWEPGISSDQRAERGRRLRWKNLDEVVKATGDADRKATRDALGVGGLGAAVEVLGALLPEVDHGRRLGERLYRQLSGRGHAMPWTVVAAGERRIVAKDDYSETRLLKPDLPQLIGALEPTLKVVQMAIDRYGDLAGLGQTGWWASRPTPPTWPAS